MIFKVHLYAFDKGHVRNVEVPDEECSDDTNKMLDLIFRYGQNDFQPQPSCSVSVGDVIEYKGEKHLVKFVGFEKVDNDFEKELKRGFLNPRVMEKCL